jgi:TctA family transporter
MVVTSKALGTLGTVGVGTTEVVATILDFMQIGNLYTGLRLRSKKPALKHGILFMTLERILVTMCVYKILG